MFKISKLKYGLVVKKDKKYFTLLYEANDFYEDILNDGEIYTLSGDKYVFLLNGFNFSDFLMKNKMIDEIKTEYTKEELIDIMNEILEKQSN